MNCHTGNSSGEPAAIPMRTVPPATTGATPTAIMAGMPTTPASIAAGAEPVMLPHRMATANTPSATTDGRSPPNSTIRRTRVAAIPVSSMRVPSQEPSSTAIMVAARVAEPVCRTVVRILFSSPCSGAPARIAMPSASSASAKAVGSTRVSISTTPTAIRARIA